MELVGQHGDQFQRIESMRVLQAVLGVISTILVYALVRQLAGRWPALVAAALFSADPYVLRQNGRILQETAALLFVLAGYVCLLAVARAPARRSPASVWGVGLMFGLAVLTKDMSAGVTVLPILVLVVTGWGPARRILATALVISAVPYGLYALWTWQQGLGGELWEAKTSGLQRIIGIDVYTGYNVQGLSVTATIMSQLLDYGLSFAVFGIGVLGGALLLMRPRHDADRIVGLFTIAAAGIVAYAALFSTIEEHFLYFVAVPGLASAVIAVTRLLDLGARSPRHRRPMIVAVVAAMLLVVGLDAAAWVRTRTVPDNAQQEAVSWLEHHAPKGATVAVVAEQTQEALQGTGLNAVILDESPEVMVAQDVTYLVVMKKLVDQGYTETSPATMNWYRARSTTAFSARSRSYGEVTVLRTTDVDAW